MSALNKRPKLATAGAGVATFALGAASAILLSGLTVLADGSRTQSVGETGKAENGRATTGQQIRPAPAPDGQIEMPRPGIPIGEERLKQLKRQPGGDAGDSEIDKPAR